MYVCEKGHESDAPPVGKGRTRCPECRRGRHARYYERHRDRILREREARRVRLPDQVFGERTEV